MKLTRKEFEGQLALAKTLPAESRTALLATLKSAQVVEVAEDGTETAVTIEIVEAPVAKAVEPKPEPDLNAIVNEAVDAKIDALTKNAPTKAPKAPADDSRIVVPATVKRARLKNFKGVVNGVDAELRAYKFGQWALATIARSMPQRFGHLKSAVEFADKHFTKAVHVEGTNTLGGYLVPEEFGTDLIDLREQYGVFRRNAKVRPMSSDTRTDPRRVSGLTAYFVAEGAAGTESNKGWDQVRLVAKDLMVISRYTAQLSADAVISIGDDLAGEIGYAFALKEDQCGFLGDGTSTYGGIVGVSQKLINVNGVDDGGGLVLASGNAFSEFTLADFHKVVGRLPQYAAGMGPKWYASRTVYYEVMQKLAFAAGGVTSNEIIGGNSTPTFLGFPVEVSQVLPASDANSQVACLFGALDQAASFGDRQQDAIAFSEHATIGGENVFERNEIAIRGTQRFDINVHDVGTSSAAGPVVGLISAAS